MIQNDRKCSNQANLIQSNLPCQATQFNTVAAQEEILGDSGGNSIMDDS